MLVDLPIENGIYSGFTHWNQWIFPSFSVNVYQSVSRPSLIFFLRSERQPGDAGLRGTAGYLWVIVSSQKRPQIAEIQWNPITKNHQMFMEAPKEWAANHHHWHFWADGLLNLSPWRRPCGRTFWFAQEFHLNGPKNV